MGSHRDWSEVRKHLSTDKWYLLGLGVAYTNISGVASGSVQSMQGVEVLTRNTRRDPSGKRYADVYLRIRKDE